MNHNRDENGWPTPLCELRMIPKPNITEPNVIDASNSRGKGMNALQAHYQNSGKHRFSNKFTEVTVNNKEEITNDNFNGDVNEWHTPLGELRMMQKTNITQPDVIDASNSTGKGRNVLQALDQNSGKHRFSNRFTEVVVNNNEENEFMKFHLQHHACNELQSTKKCKDGLEMLLQAIGKRAAKQCISKKIIEVKEKNKKENEGKRIHCEHPTFNELDNPAYCKEGYELDGIKCCGCHKEFVSKLSQDKKERKQQWKPGSGKNLVHGCINCHDCKTAYCNDCWNKKLLDTDNSGRRKRKSRN